MDTYGDTQYSETAKNLLTQHRQKKITLAEFLSECAFWALRNGFQELTPAPLPTPPNTAAWNEYQALTSLRKLKIESQFFSQNPEINEYYHQVSIIKQRNKHLLEWLREIRNYLPQEDEINLRKIDNRITEFLAWFDDNPIEVEKLKKTFQAKIFQSGRNYTTPGEIINNLY